MSTTDTTPPFEDESGRNKAQKFVRVLLAATTVGSKVGGHLPPEQG